jgi:chromosome segregation ATPase
MSNAKEGLVNDLEKRQAEIESAIQDAVRNGDESAKLRAELKAVQQQLTVARADVASMQAHDRQAISRAVANAGDELGTAAVDRIVGGAAHFDELLAGVQVPKFDNAPAVIAQAHNVSAAQRRGAEADAAHAAATADVDELTVKVAAKRERHAELLRQRITGDAGEGSHAELYALGEDIRTLDEMHATAKAKANNLLPTVHEARIALKSAEKQAATIEHRLAAQHLADHAKALDAALVACLRACQAEGAKAGVGIGSLAPISLELRTYVSSGVLPAQFRRA